MLSEKLEKSLEGFSNPSYVFPMVFNIANTETIEENGEWVEITEDEYNKKIRGQQ